MLSTTFDKLNQQFITELIQKFTGGDVSVATYLTTFLDVLIDLQP